MPAMSSPLKYPGGKHYLASRIVNLMPAGYTHYVEPYAGGLSVLLANDPEGISEVVNDINSDLCKFWCVLQSTESFAEMRRLLEATPVAEPVWNYTDSHFQNPLPVTLGQHAAMFFCHVRQSLAGRRTAFTGVTKTRTRRGMNAEASAWLSAVEGLPAVHERLKRVLILNRPAIAVITGQDGPTTLFYCDPPYLHETRVTTDEYGEYEMTPEQHLELLATLDSISGKFMLSGYHSAIYDEWARAAGYTCHEFHIANSASHQATKPVKIECIWVNY